MRWSIQQFLKLESASGIVLFMAALFALVWDNSRWADFYQSLFNAPFVLHLGMWTKTETLSFWVNDGFMTVFFLLVALELKREFLEGELKGFSNVILPGMAALGGMLVPAIIYWFVNYPDVTVKGWSVPVATDIAFALGVLSLFGKRVPLGLKLFLMALAIFDDIGAIIIIALVHTHAFSYPAVLGAVMVLLVLFVFNRWGVQRLIFYCLLGFFLWLCLFSSGLHPTIAGVLLAFMVPLGGENNSPLKRLEDALHAWVAFGVMPLFALANAGVSFYGLHLSVLLNKVTLGIVLGLLLGKQLGIFSFSALMIKMRWANLPPETSWLLLYSVACLGGVGFTMSLFLGALAFQGDVSNLMNVRLGVLLGSGLSGVIGAAILYVAVDRRSKAGRMLKN